MSKYGPEPYIFPYNKVYHHHEPKKKERKERKALQICFHKTITNIQFLETQRTKLLEKETKIWRQGSGGEKRQTQEPHTPVDTTHKGKGTASRRRRRRRRVATPPPL